MESGQRRGCWKEGDAVCQEKHGEGAPGTTVQHLLGHVGAQPASSSDAPSLRTRGLLGFQKTRPAFILYRALGPGAYHSAISPSPIWASAFQLKSKGFGRGRGFESHVGGAQGGPLEAKVGCGPPPCFSQSWRPTSRCEDRGYREIQFCLAKGFAVSNSGTYRGVSGHPSPTTCPRSWEAPRAGRG